MLSWLILSKVGRKLWKPHEQLHLGSGVPFQVRTYFALPSPVGKRRARWVDRGSLGLWIDIKVLANPLIRMRSAGGHDFADSWRNRQRKLLGPALPPRVPTYFRTHLSKSIRGVLAKRIHEAPSNAA
jgi:hypothetical protein